MSNDNSKSKPSWREYTITITATPKDDPQGKELEVKSTFDIRARGHAVVVALINRITRQLTHPSSKSESAIKSALQEERKRLAAMVLFWAPEWDEDAGFEIRKLIADTILEG